MTQQITLVRDKILSDNYFTLHNITYDLIRKDSEVTRHKREAYDYGDSTTVLLYDTKKKTMALIRQFRVAARASDSESERLIESCAGLLDNGEPEVRIRKKAIEEMGYEVDEVCKLFKLYMSPGSVTELVRSFVTGYDGSQHASAGGDVGDEDIKVPELPFSQVLKMVKTGEICNGKVVLLFNCLRASHLTD